MGKIRNAYKILVGYLKERGHLKDVGLDGRIILQWILEKQGGKLRTGFIWFRMKTSGGIL
jgi:hypothetical protein